MDNQQHPTTSTTQLQPLKHAGFLLYVVLFLAFCLLPLVGMLWAATPSTSGTPAAPAPASATTATNTPTLTQPNGALNTNYLPQWGTYFETHFAYRNLALDQDARLKVTLLNTSPTSQVIVGTNNWLYYGGELNDYLARAPLTPRQAHNMAYNMALMQGYTQAHGAHLIVTIAPNKSSAYPAHMPYYYQSVPNNSMALLKDSFNDKDVVYLDLFSLFDAQEGEWYSRTDSHWDNQGALLVSNGLLEACGKPVFVDTTGEASYPPIMGDLEKMLYPVSASREYQRPVITPHWDLVDKASTVEDAFIVTQGGGSDTLLMFRDSFANNLIPILAPQFGRGYFSKMVPYDLTQIERLEPDFVVIERAERHVGLFAQDPALMPAPTVKAEADYAVKSDTTVHIERDGDYWVVWGWVDEACMELDDNIFVQVDGPDGRVCYVPFHISGQVEGAGAGGAAGAAGAGGVDADAVGLAEEAAPLADAGISDYGYKGYLPLSAFKADGSVVTILVVKGDTNTVLAVASTDFAQ